MCLSQTEVPGRRESAQASRPAEPPGTTVRWINTCRGRRCTYGVPAWTGYCPRTASEPNSSGNSREIEKECSEAAVRALPCAIEILLCDDWEVSAIGLNVPIRHAWLLRHWRMEPYLMAEQLMETDEILRKLDRSTGTFEQAAVEAAVLRREEITPELLRILEETVERAEQLDAEDDFIGHLYAMFLLAQFRETRAYELVVRLASLLGELPHSLCGDFITEDLGRFWRRSVVETWPAFSRSSRVSALTNGCGAPHWMGS